MKIQLAIYCYTDYQRECGGNYKKYKMDGAEFKDEKRFFIRAQTSKTQPSLHIRIS